MRYGKFLKKGRTLEVVSPSFGVTIEPYISRLEKTNKDFKKLGINIIEGPNLRMGSYKIASNTPKLRAKEFMDAYLDNNVDFILSSGGGEVMMEILPFIDFEQIKNASPKFFGGFSDNTWLSFTLPTICDVAALYCHNYCGLLGTHHLHDSQKKCLDTLFGKIQIQKSYPKIQEKNENELDPLADIKCSIKTQWKSLSNNNENVSGRIVGGCLDILVSLLGTEYDKFAVFKKRYAKDGVILFAESCDLNLFGQYRAFLQLKYAGWFDNLKAVIIGRPLNNESILDWTYEEMLHMVFDDLNIPVIYDVDIGHTNPKFTIINGSYVEIEYKNKKGSIKTSLI